MILLFLVSLPSPGISDLFFSNHGSLSISYHDLNCFLTYRDAQIFNSSECETIFCSFLHPYMWLGPAQDVPYALILWYVSKIICLSYEYNQFSIKSSKLFIYLIVRAFIVRYQYYTINVRYKNVMQRALYFAYKM